MLLDGVKTTPPCSFVDNARRERERAGKVLCSRDECQERWMGWVVTERGCTEGLMLEMVDVDVTGTKGTQTSPKMRLLRR
jgi:hypothetical protein